jgi:hypothetical protein
MSSRLLAGNFSLKLQSPFTFLFFSNIQVRSRLTDLDANAAHLLEAVVHGRVRVPKALDFLPVFSSSLILQSNNSFLVDKSSRRSTFSSDISTDDTAKALDSMAAGNPPA